MLTYTIIDGRLRHVTFIPPVYEAVYIGYSFTKETVIGLETIWDDDAVLDNVTMEDIYSYIDTMIAIGVKTIAVWLYDDYKEISNGDDDRRIDMLCYYDGEYICEP